MPAETSDHVIRVRRVSKDYKVWRSPAARLIGLLASGLAQTWLTPPPLRRFLQRRIARLYTAFHALSDVSLEVRRGESVGIVGMNGSGKSTLLQLIAGVLTPTAGSVEKDGRIAALLELGSGFNPEFTGRENASMNASILGLSRSEIQRRMPAIESFAELGEFFDQPIKSYSSGMIVRLAFAVMTQVDPQILIVDEALAVGDAYFQYKCIGHIRDFRDRGGSLLFVSHDASAVKSLCSRALLLEQGRAIKEGPPDAVLDYYNALIARKERDYAVEQVKTESGRHRTRSGNGAATIEEVNLLDEAGNETRSLQTGDRATIALTVQAHQDLESPTVGIMILDRLGNEVFGTNLSLLSPKPASWQSGERVQVHFDITINLCQGTYSLTVAAHAAHTHVESNYDWIDHALIFKVMAETPVRMTGCAALPVTARVFSDANAVAV